MIEQSEKKNIKLICVGNLKENYWKAAESQYLQSISKWARINIIEISNERVPVGSNPTLENAVKDREADAMLKRVDKADYVIALEICGKPLSSDEFSKMLCEKNDPVFMIGGTLGLGAAVIKRSNSSLSFSGFTLPHQLMRIVLLEQINRVKYIL